MIEQDTIKLLRDCDAGSSMGISSIDEVLDQAEDGALRQILETCRDEHDQLAAEIRKALIRFGDEGKRPSPIAKKMAGMMTEMKLAVHDSDRTIADMMTDGCNMGVKSLSRYLNQYQAADEASKDIAKRLIALEERLAVELRGYL